MYFDQFKHVELHSDFSTMYEETIKGLRDGQIELEELIELLSNFAVNPFD